MERILAIDPGERVGWCHGVILSSDDVSTYEKQAQPAELEVTGHGITPLKDFAIKLAEVIGNYDRVIYEIYRIQPGKERQHVGSEVPTLQFIGMARLLGWLSDVQLVRQTTTHRDTGYKRAPEWCPQIQEIIERLPKTHDDAHDGDALAHLAYYYTQHYL